MSHLLGLRCLYRIIKITIWKHYRSKEGQGCISDFGNGLVINPSLLFAFRELLPCTAGSTMRTVDLLA
jgi:hypothetical protein